jgi:hypothetical protein
MATTERIGEGLTFEKPKVEDIDYHIERMEKLRRYADLHNDTRKYLGP